MVETPEGEMAMRWTLFEGYSRDRPMKALLDFNFAKNVNEFHEAIQYLLTGFNFVMADVDGHIASQVSGLLPIRKKGFGLLPQNGSSGQYDWVGLVPHENQYYEIDPSSGYLTTANERVDNRELFMISEDFAHRYRDDRISRILDNGTDFEIDVEAIHAGGYHTAPCAKCKKMVNTHLNAVHNIVAKVHTSSTNNKSVQTVAKIT